jgi:predicted metal-dependent enzyme (double-stranded beta helix superfamily)
MSALMDEAKDDEKTILKRGKALLSDLIATDGWLADDYAKADPDRYQQYLLYCDPQDRFSVVSFVWGPGQETPVHDHLVWGLVGMLRGSEVSQAYDVTDTGLKATRRDILNQGEVVAVSPRIGDIHKVSNNEADMVSVSIHVYGTDIGAIDRHVFDESGGQKSFVSGYSNDTLPNVWGLAR